MKRWFTLSFMAVALATTVALTGIAIAGAQLPNGFYTTDLTADVSLTMGVSVSPGRAVRASSSQVGGRYTGTAKWLGVFPVKTVDVRETKRRTVALGGIPFGLKLYTDGVMVVGMADVDTAAGKTNPAKSAGIQIGDVILKINEQAVLSNEQVADMIEQADGSPLRMWVRRGQLEFSVTFLPALSASEGRRKAGIWVRDSSAGIGTLTFFDPETLRFAGLGHAVCDIDTGKVIPLAAGEIVPARICGVKKGARGAPGELQGVFAGTAIGWLDGNGEKGVYGTLSESLKGHRTVEVALKQEVKTGAAQIYATVDGDAPRFYEVEIRQVRLRDNTATRNMLISVTDPDLLALTGGIVQGMSGSPLIQNGKLIGAITHVLVDDPTTGYAIFAENMLETAQTLANKGEIKDAS